MRRIRDDYGILTRYATWGNPVENVIMAQIMVAPPREIEEVSVKLMERKKFNPGEIFQIHTGVSKN